MHPLVLIWLAGVALRLTILAVPPVLALIRDDLALSATQVGLLSGIPPLLFAGAALVGSLLVARVGVKAALLGGLAMVAAGSALRGATDGYLALLGTTAFMAAGVAIMQPVMPTTVKQWLPKRIALGTAVYTNGLLVGEIIPVLLTLPIVLPWAHGSWRSSLVLWSLPIAAIALLVAIAAPRATGPVAAVAGDTSRKWLPDWHEPLVWRLGALFIAINSIYFCTNAFLPIYLTSKGRPDLISSALTGLNFGQLPASFLLLAVARRVERRAWTYIVAGVVSLVATLSMVLFVGPYTWFWAGLQGFAVAAALITGLTLTPLLCKPEDVARTSAGVFTLSYGSSVLIALLCGAAWDLTGIPLAAFVPLVLCSVGLVWQAARLRRSGELL